MQRSVISTRTYLTSKSKILLFFRQFLNVSALCSFDTIDTSDENFHYRVQETSENPNAYYTMLKGIMHKCAKSGLFEEAVNALNSMKDILGKPTVYDYNALLYYYLKSNDVCVQYLIDIYIEMKKLGLYPNALTFNTLTNGLIKLGHLKFIPNILEEMCIFGFVPSFSCLENFLMKSLISDSLADSFIALELMLKFDYLPTVRSLRILISSFCKSGMVHEAYFMFDKITSRGLFPDVYSYNPILWGLCRSGETLFALSIFYLLRRKGFVHNVCSYTSIIHGFSKEGMWDDAFKMLDEMKRDRVKPNTITYTTLIKFLLEYRKITEALDILQIMEKEGCDPDIVTYNIILRTLCGHRMIKEACELMSSIGNKGICPDAFTYTALIGGMLKSGEKTLATELLFDIICNGSGMDLAICNIYFNILSLENRLGDAFSLLDSVKQTGIFPNNVTYNILLNALCRGSDMDNVFEYFNHLDWGQNGPDLISFNTILSAAVKKANSSIMRRVLYRMEFEKMKFDTVGLSCFIQYFCMIGKFSESFQLFDHAIRHSLQPSIFNYNVLLHGLCKRRLLGIAYRVFHDLKQKGISPDVTTYNILIHSSIRAKNPLLAKWLVRDMEKQGVVFDSITYGILIYWHCMEGHMAGALSLRNNMVEEGLSRTINMYNTILDALFRGERLWEVFLALAKMEMDDCKPNPVTYSILNRAMTKGGMKRSPEIMKYIEFLMKYIGRDAVT